MKGILFILSSIVFSLLIGCGGGGGGGDDFSGAAAVSLSLTPTNVDTGDRVQADIDVSSIYPNGIVVKIRYPAGLTYVSATSFLQFGNGSPIDISPEGEFQTTAQGVTYLVYILDQALINNRDSAKISFELQANQSTDDESDNFVAVDADVDDGTNFDVNNPEFSSDDEQEIKVRPST